MAFADIKAFGTAKVHEIPDKCVVELDESSVKGSGSSSNGPKNVFDRHRYFRSDKKLEGEFWEVDFK